VNALIKHSKKLPTELYKSLTWDRGKELADHTDYGPQLDNSRNFDAICQNSDTHGQEL